MKRSALLSLIACLLLGVAPAGAQRPDVPQGDGILSGVVVTSQGQPVDSAQLTITELKLSLRTARDGTFRFEGVEAGEYELTFRRIGFRPQVWNVGVREGGTAVVLQVETATPMLPPIITRASRIGVGGIVMDTANQPLRGAEVSLNAGRRTRTDDAGRFFIRTPSGRYLLHVRQKGYATQLVGVNVLPDSGRDVVVWLTPTERGAAAREAFVMDSLRRRLLVRNPVWSRLFTREDINRIGFTRLDQIAIAGSGRPLPVLIASAEGECMATVDGLRRVPLWALDAADVEFVEVYGSKPARPNRGNLRTGPQTETFASAGCPTVFVWLRR